MSKVSFYGEVLLHLTLLFVVLIHRLSYLISLQERNIWSHTALMKLQLPILINRAWLHIFHAKTGKVIRSFRKNADVLATTEPLQGTPIKWANGNDDKYFAIMENNVLHVYETVAKIDDCSLKMKDVQSFSWSPTDPIIAAFVPESCTEDQPAKVTLIDVQSKQEPRQKNL
ncbi:hypothetical protein ACH5RR_040430 [Cinchona calisaya]|uniref:Translation initiation factor beta propellor-like domain-containing protein n=1 Tax=Cinchona calisaya TaxID=153742 RepID=A0ABD2XSC8_9GENT